MATINTPNTSSPRTTGPLTGTEKKSATEKKMDAFMDPNAYKNVAGLLMGVLKDLSLEEMKLRMANAQQRVSVAQAEATTATTEADATTNESGAQAVSGAAGAITGAGAAMYGFNGMKQMGTISKEETAKVDAKTAEIKSFRSPTGMGTAPTVPNGLTHEQHIKNLEHERSECMTARDHAITDHRGTIENMGRLEHVVKGFGDIGTSIATGQARSSSVNARNAGEFAKQVAQDVQANQKSNDDVSSKATDLAGQVAKVAEAQVRG